MYTLRKYILVRNSCCHCLVSNPEGCALCLRLEMVKVKISNFPVSSECSCNGFVFSIQTVVPESYTQIKDVTGGGEKTSPLALGHQTAAGEWWENARKEQKYPWRPQRLHLSDRGDIFSSGCAFEVEFLVWLLQLRRLPGSCKILHALGCLRTLTFLEKSSEISSSFSWRSSQGSSAIKVKSKSWFVGGVCILVIKEQI